MNKRVERVQNEEVKRAPQYKTDLAEKAAAHYIEQGKKITEKLACPECAHPELCAAAIHPLISRNAETIPEQEVDLIESYNIQVRDRRLLCPGGLVETAIRHSTNKEFWLLTTDPLIPSSIELQSAEAIRQTVASLVTRLETGQRI